MYKKIILLLLGSILSVSLEAQLTFTPLGGPPGGSIEQIVGNSEGELFSVSKGGLFKSVDAAASWSRLPLPANVSVSDAYIDKNDNIYLLIGTGILKSSDGGETWVQRTATGSFQFVRKLRKNETSGTLFAIGYTGSNYGLIRSTDDGTTWTFSFSATQVNDFAIKNTTTFSHIYIATNDGNVGFKIMKNTSDGNSLNWTATSNGVTGTPISIAVNKTNGNLYALFYSSGAYYSTNDGSTWIAVSTASTTMNFANGNGYWRVFTSENSDNWFILDDADKNQPSSNKRLYRNSTATGTSWSELNNLSLNSSFNALYSFSTTILVGATDQGILRSTNNGSTWQGGDNGILGADVSAIEYIPAYRNLAATYGTNRVLFSDDINSDPAFKSWNKILAAGNMTSLVLMSTNKVLAIGSQTYETTTGSSYTLVGNSPGSVTLQKAHRFSDTKIYALSSGSNNVVYQTVNGGVNWSVLNITGLPTSKEIRNISTTTNGDLYLGLIDNSNGVFKIYRVPNASTAASQLTTSGLGTLYSIQASGSKIYALGFQSGYKLAISINNGTSWTIKNSLVYDDILVPREGIIFGVGENGQVHLSNDDADTWQALFTPTSGSTLVDVVLDPAENYQAYLAFRNGPIWRSNGSVIKPNAPTNLRSVANGSNVIYLQWDYSSLVNPDRFDLERKEVGTSEFTLVDYYTSTNTRFAEDFTVQPGKEYIYRIKAGNSAGFSYSNELTVSSKAICSASIPDNRSWTGTVVGATPITTISIKKITGDIYSVSDILANSLDLAPFNIPSPRPAAIYENCGTPFINDVNNIYPNGLGTWNGTNTLTLKWQITSGASTTNKTITFTLNSTDPAPEVPIGLSAYASSTNKATLIWSSGLYQQKYYVERSTTAAFTSGTVTNVGTVNYPTTSIVDNGPLTPGTYYYRVKAENINSVQSAYSAVHTLQFSSPNFVLSNTTVSSTLYNAVNSVWFDMDNDNDDDLLLNEYGYFNQTAREPKLFRNTGSGDFTEVTGAIGSGFFNGAAAGDYNKDGNVDLFFTGFGSGQNPSITKENRLFTGNGNTTFSEVNGTPFGTSLSIAPASSWLDVNKDGHLDLIIPYTNGTKLYLGDGTGGFTERTGDPLVTDAYEASALVWGDYDNDGDQDVFIIDDNGTNKIYENTGSGNFVNANITAFSTDTDTYASAAWGDYDNDGDLDLYITQSEDGANAGPNLLYRNNGNKTFTKLASVANTPTENKTAASFGCAWIDIDNDADLDLIVTNVLSNASIYLNNGTGVFTKAGKEYLTAGPTFYFPVSVTASDYNLDGFQDVLVTDFVFSEGGNIVPRQIKLMENSNVNGNWLKIKLRGVNSNASAIGARIRLTSGGKTQIREVQSSVGVFGQNSFIQHFGLGAATTVTSIQINWPSGIVQTLTNVPANGLIEIIEDNTGPVITQRSPLNAANNINANTTLSVTFNEIANAVAARNLRIFKTTDLVTPVATVAVTNAVKTGNTFTFTLAQKLENSTSYSISIDAGAFEDIYGNDFTGLATSAWQFTTTAGPAPTLLSPANNANNVGVNTTLEITFNRTITGVAGKSVDVFIQGSSAPEFSIDAATGTITGNKITFTLPETLAFQTLYDVEVEAGAFIDNFSNASNLITWSFLTVDNIAPVINFTAPVSINKGTATTLSPLITDNSGEIGTAVLHYRKISASTFSTLAGSISASVANQFDFAVPTTFFDETGLEYYFTATDLSGNEVRSPAGTNTHKLLIRYSLDDSEIPSAQLGFGGAKTNWKIFSVPFELGNSNSVSSIFDELSDLENKTDYRLLKYKDQTSWGEFPSDFSTITRGEGYFINIKVAEDILIGEGMLAPSNDRNNLFTLNLKQGWNMIGNPYLSTISWADVSAYNALTGTNAVLVKYTSGQYVQTNQNLLPFEGGLVFASAAATISIPFAGQTSATTRQDEVTFSDTDWLMPLTIVNGEVENTFGGIGMHKLADESFDQFDGVNPPRFFEFSELNFAHPEHFAKNFSRDVVPTANKYMWEFSVSTNQSGSATLTWDNSGLTNRKQQLYLFDEAMQQPVNMLAQSHYSFNPKASSRFRIYYGDNILNEMLPNMFQLGKAYPNPSAGVVSIPFSLSEAGGTQQQVAIEVIDAMGKNLGTILEKSYAPGLHTFEWNGANLINSQGLYIFKVMVDNAQGKQIQQTRILINK
jgi:photosystem II stability/assembly factor-like uncharacterized protein